MCVNKYLLDFKSKNSICRLSLSHCSGMYININHLLQQIIREYILSINIYTRLKLGMCLHISADLFWV